MNDPVSLHWRDVDCGLMAQCLSEMFQRKDESGGSKNVRAVLGPRLAECWTQVRDKVEFAENGESIPADMYTMFDDVVQYS